MWHGGGQARQPLELRVPPSTIVTEWWAVVILVVLLTPANMNDKGDGGVVRSSEGLQTSRPTPPRRSNVPGTCHCKRTASKLEVSVALLMGGRQGAAMDRAARASKLMEAAAK